MNYLPAYFSNVCSIFLQIFHKFEQFNQQIGILNKSIDYVFYMIVNLLRFIHYYRLGTAVQKVKKSVKRHGNVVHILTVKWSYESLSEFLVEVMNEFITGNFLFFDKS